MEESLKLKKRHSLRNNEYYAMQNIFDNLYIKSCENKKFTKLMQYISSENNILLAYRNIKKNKGSTTVGTDNLDISYFKDMETKKFVKRIPNKLVNYQPKSVRRVEIPKPNGKTRPLGIPCIEDRIIQQCIKQILEPICEAKFHKHSYGFRPNRSTEHAIATGLELEIGNMVCHHKIQKSDGGSNEYKNLVWICEEVHKLIHCTKRDTIDKYLGLLSLNKKSQFFKKVSRKFRYLIKKKKIVGTPYEAKVSRTV